MTLLAYFQHLLADFHLLKPDGPLSTALPVSTITAVYKKVKQVRTRSNQHGRGG